MPHLTTFLASRHIRAIHWQTAGADEMYEASAGVMPASRRHDMPPQPPPEEAWKEGETKEDERPREEEARWTGAKGERAEREERARGGKRRAAMGAGRQSLMGEEAQWQATRGSVGGGGGGGVR